MATSSTIQEHKQRTYTQDLHEAFVWDRPYTYLIGDALRRHRHHDSLQIFQPPGCLPHEEPHMREVPL